MKGWRGVLGYWLLFNLVYFGFAMFSLETRDPWSLSSSVWAPSGLVLGVLCISPRIYWSIWGISAGVLHVIVSLFYGRPLDVSLTFALLDLVLIFPLALIWRTVKDFFRYTFQTEMVFLIIGIYIISLTGGVISMFLLQWLNYPVLLSHFTTWSLANATGCLSCAPFFIFHRFYKERSQTVAYYQYAVLLTVSVIFCLPPELMLPDLLRWVILYLVVLGLLVLAASLPLKSLSICFLYLTLIISFATLFGAGPLATNDARGLESTQLFLLAVMTLGLLLAGHENESAMREEALEQQLLSLSRVMEKHKPVLFRFSPDSGAFHWSGNTTIFGIPSHEIPTLMLLLARIHPEDQGTFSRYISGALRENSLLEQKAFRLLLPDNQYHTIHYSCVPALSGKGCTGALVLDS